MRRARDAWRTSCPAHRDRTALADADVAGAGLDADAGAAAVDVSNEVMALKAAMGGDGRVAVNAAGAGAGVEGVSGAAGGEQDGAAAGFKLPRRTGAAADLKVAGAGLGGERAGDVVEPQGAAAGFRLDVDAALELSVDVAGAGVEVGLPGYVAGVDVAGPGAGAERGLEAGDLKIAGAAGGGERCALGGGDFVVDGDVPDPVGMLADGDGVAGLLDGWIVDDLLDAVLGGASAEKAGAGVDMADDVDLRVRAGSDVDVAGACADAEDDGAGDVEGLVEFAFSGESGGGAQQQSCECEASGADLHKWISMARGRDRGEYAAWG